MKVEELDRSLLEQELGVAVVINDDQSENSMYDLRVGPPADAEMAIECVRATDPLLRALFGTLLKKPKLTGGFCSHWTVELRAEANVKELYSELPRLLTEMEAHGIATTHNQSGMPPRHHYLLDELEKLGIGFAFSRTGRPATVDFLPPGAGGAVDEYGESVPSWISDFLSQPRNEDVVRKLQKAKAKRREVFVRADEYGVPWPVVSYLTDDLIHLPLASPKLPRAIDGVWLVYGKRGIRWDGLAWSFIRHVI